MTNFIKRDGEEVFKEEFLEFAGYNLQRRAIPDARDGLKWGARQLLFSQSLGGFVYNKPFKKAIKSVSQAMGYCYVHGDASAYGTFIRMAKPFAYRYPLQEANGNYGTCINPDDHSASRYVELRGSEICSYLLKDLDKETIDEWEDTYDLEGQFPKVLPSKGFWAGVNGCISIGSGMSCSIPPTNLKEVNEALIKLIDNNDIDAKEIICLPDFPTGAILLNKNEVIESLLNGNGKACRVRANVEWDTKEKCFIVKEVPYSTYTNTICNELTKLIIEDEQCPIEEFVDYTGKTPDLRIYIKKNNNPDKVLKYLYKNTSLETFFSINMTVLDNGIVPKVMGQKELFLSYLSHEKIVYRKGFEFDLRKIEGRIHIIEGLLICLAKIDEVVQTIKNSDSTASASKSLQTKFLLDESQAKAVLDMKLSRLAHLEVKKLEDEKVSLENEARKIRDILENEEKFNNEIKKGLKLVAERFGDERRTKILNLSTTEEDVIEEKSIQVSLTNHNNIYAQEISSLYTQKRGAVGSKLKLNQGEYVVDSTSLKTSDTIVFFSKKGDCYHCPALELPLEVKTSLFQFIELPDYDNIITLTSLTKKPYIVFITRNGYMKKSESSEYNMNRKGAIRALTLEEDDEIINVLFIKDEKIGIATENGNFLMTPTIDVRPIGRITKGIIGIKLNEDDHVISAKIIPDDTKFIASITGAGNIKKTQINEFSPQGKNTKGAKIQKLNDLDWIADFLPIKDEKEILVSATSSIIKFKVDEIPTQGRGTLGVKAIKLQGKDNVIQILKI